VATTSAGLAAWIGALVNIYKLQDRTWFAVLLAGALLGFAFSLLGLAAMVGRSRTGSYLVAFGRTVQREAMRSTLCTA
jgi:hypothetical protein